MSHKLLYRNKYSFISFDVSKSITNPNCNVISRSITTDHPFKTQHIFEKPRNIIIQVWCYLLFQDSIYIFFDGLFMLRPTRNKRQNLEYK